MGSRRRGVADDLELRSAVRSSCVRCLDDGGEQLVPFCELPAAQEVLLDDIASGVAEGARSCRVGEQLGDRVPEATQVGRVDQETVVLVVDLVAVAADVAGDDGASLPQRFGDAKPEALLETLS